MTEFLTWPTRQVWPLFLRDRTCSYSLTTVSYLSARGASHGSLETYPSMYAKVRGSIPGGLGKLRLGELVTDKTWREGSEMQVWEPPRRVENRFEGPKKKGGTRCTLNGQETKEVTATHSANVTTFCVAFKWNNRDALSMFCLCTDLFHYLTSKGPIIIRIIHSTKDAISSEFETKSCYGIEAFVWL